MGSSALFLSSINGRELCEDNLILSWVKLSLVCSSPDLEGNLVIRLQNLVLKTRLAEIFTVRSLMFLPKLTVVNLEDSLVAKLTPQRKPTILLVFGEGDGFFRSGGSFFRPYVEIHSSFNFFEDGRSTPLDFQNEEGFNFPASRYLWIYQELGGLNIDELQTCEALEYLVTLYQKGDCNGRENQTICENYEEAHYVFDDLSQRDVKIIVEIDSFDTFLVLKSEGMKRGEGAGFTPLPFMKMDGASGPFMIGDRDVAVHRDASLMKQQRADNSKFGDEAELSKSIARVSSRPWRGLVVAKDVGYSVFDVLIHRTYGFSEVYAKRALMANVVQRDLFSVLMCDYSNVLTTVRIVMEVICCYFDVIFYVKIVRLICGIILYRRIYGCCSWCCKHVTRLGNIAAMVMSHWNARENGHSMGCRSLVNGEGTWSMRFHQVKNGVSLKGFIADVGQGRVFLIGMDSMVTRKFMVMLFNSTVELQGKVGLYCVKKQDGEDALRAAGKSDGENGKDVEFFWAALNKGPGMDCKCSGIWELLYRTVFRGGFLLGNQTVQLEFLKFEEIREGRVGQAENANRSDCWVEAFALNSWERTRMLTDVDMRGMRMEGYAHARWKKSRLTQTGFWQGRTKHV